MVKLIKDFINGDVIELAFVNPKTSRTYGANGAVNVTEEVIQSSYIKSKSNEIFRQ